MLLSQRGEADMETSREATDKAMMARAIELSRQAVKQGEYPFGTVIARHGVVLAEAINCSIRKSDVAGHAEVIALSEAHKAVGKEGLREATLYSNVEPCAMCSYCIREVQVGRVAFALASPVMGGFTKWNILRDEGISKIPQIFGPVPEVVAGILAADARQAWRDWSTLAWRMIELRGLLIEPLADPASVHVAPAHRRSLWQHLQMLFARH
jgi:tRNA(adenine34) deaminase